MRKKTLPTSELDREVWGTWLFLESCKELQQACVWVRKVCVNHPGRSGLCPRLPLQVLNNPTGLQQGVAPVLQWEVRALCLWARGV